MPASCPVEENRTVHCATGKHSCSIRAADCARRPPVQRWWIDGPVPSGPCRMSDSSASAGSTMPPMTVAAPIQDRSDPVRAARPTAKECAGPLKPSRYAQGRCGLRSAEMVSLGPSKPELCNCMTEWQRQHVRTLEGARPNACSCRVVQLLFAVTEV